MSAHERKTKKERSPTYPAIDLATALDRAQQLWKSERDHWAPIPAIFEAWGYSQKSSGAAQTVAALKRYGLLEDRGTLHSREGRLTEFARAILLDERQDSKERPERLQQAALLPRINREIWDKYDGSLPSDSTLRYHLTVERGFSPAGASDFLRQFHRTLEFARLTGEAATVSPGGEEESPDEAEDASIYHLPPVTAGGPIVARLPSSPLMPANAPPPIQFPVYGGGTVVLQSSVPLTEQAWNQMMDVLKVLKPSIVTSEPFEVQLENEGARVRDSDEAPEEG
jgi:hypothetical protein